MKDRPSLTKDSTGKEGFGKIPEEDASKEHLQSFAEQIVSVLFSGSNHSVKVLSSTQIDSTIHAELRDVAQSFEYVVVVDSEGVASLTEKIEKFIHKKVYVICSDRIFWCEGESNYTHSEQQNEISVRQDDANVSFRKSRTILPHWLDKFLFEQLLAVYAPEHSRFEYNLDLTKDEVRVYLGTYFPRSYAEIFCIAANLLQNTKIKDIFHSLQNIRIFDFCAGTGGELIGLLSALDKYFTEPKSIEIVACDGNEIALGKLSRILEAHSTYSPHRFDVKIEHCKISSEEDIARLLNHQGKYDFILCDKVVCELISHGIVESGYKGIARYLGEMLSANGLLLMLDVTTKDEKSQKFYPQIMNSQINELIRETENLETLLPLSCGTYKDCKASCFIQQTFTVTHRQKQKDESRVCYRILCRKNLKEGILSKNLVDMAHIINPQKYQWGLGEAFCPKSKTGNKNIIDSFNVKIS